MDYNEEIKSMLKILKSLGHDRRKIEAALGYEPMGLDQSLARKTEKGNEKLYRQVVLYKDWVTLKDSISATENLDEKDGLLRMLNESIGANKIHALANKDNAEANKKHADSIYMLVTLVSKKVSSGEPALTSSSSKTKEKVLTDPTEQMQSGKQGKSSTERRKRKKDSVTG